MIKALIILKLAQKSYMQWLCNHYTMKPPTLGALDLNTNLREIFNGRNLTLGLFTWDHWKLMLNEGKPCLGTLNQGSVAFFILT
jgi:hypothetical protein